MLNIFPRKIILFNYSAVRGVRKVTTYEVTRRLNQYTLLSNVRWHSNVSATLWARGGITGLWQPSVHSDVAF